jgi:hypothetical protein
MIVGRSRCGMIVGRSGCGMVMAASVFKGFSVKDERREAQLLDHAHGKSGRHATEQYGEENSLQHDDELRTSVAGKAEGVTGVVRGVVQAVVVSHAHTPGQKGPEEQAKHADGHAM